MTAPLPTPENSDRGLLDLLRAGPLGIGEMAEALGVTATAVRQRLSRLIGQRLIQREVARAARGRPSHRYSLTEKGRRQTGSNFTDLALALWQEIRKISEPEVRIGLLRRVAEGMAGMYAPQVSGATTAERMQSVADLLADREVPCEVRADGGLNVLTAHACPYPQLAEQDRGICAVEKLMFSELIGKNVRLDECRLDGASCCRFTTVG